MFFGSTCTPSRRGFTLIELLVVVAIIALLVAILIPSLGRARESARTAHCASGMRQWGIALEFYQNDFNRYLPSEGSTGSVAEVEDLAAWFNALPVYVNSPRYMYLFPGTSARSGKVMVDENGYTWTVGITSGTINGYKNNWIWYCQTRLANNRNSASNSFQYAFNAALNGTGTWTPNLGASGALPHNRTTMMDNPAATVLLIETDANNPAVGPSASSGPARTRHTRGNGGGNVVFIDGHVDYVSGADMPVPTGSSTGTTANSWNGQQWQTNVNGVQLVWGPFRR